MNRRNPTSSPDPWQALEAAWQAETPTSPTDVDQARKIARLGHRQLWIRRLVVLSEGLICLIFGAWSILWLASGSLPEQIAATFILTILLFAAFARRHAWFDHQMPEEEPPPARINRFLDRNAEGFRAITLGWRMLWAQVIFFLAWLPWKQHSGDADQLVETYGFLAFWTALYLCGLSLSKRHLKRERRQLEDIRSEIQAEDG